MRRRTFIQVIAATAAAIPLLSGLDLFSRPQPTPPSFSLQVRQPGGEWQDVPGAIRVDLDYSGPFDTGLIFVPHDPVMIETCGEIRTKHTRTDGWQTIYTRKVTP